MTISWVTILFDFILTHIGRTYDMYSIMVCGIDQIPEWKKSKWMDIVKEKVIMADRAVSVKLERR